MLYTYWGLLLWRVGAGSPFHTCSVCVMVQMMVTVNRKAGWWGSCAFLLTAGDTGNEEKQNMSALNDELIDWLIDWLIIQSTCFHSVNGCCDSVTFFFRLWFNNRIKNIYPEDKRIKEIKEICKHFFLPNHLGSTFQTSSSISCPSCL